MRMRLPIRRANPTAVAATQEAWAQMVAAADEKMLDDESATAALEAKVRTGWRRYRWRVGYPIGELLPGQMETTAHEGRAFTRWGASYARSRYDGSRDRNNYFAPRFLLCLFAAGMAAGSLSRGMFGQTAATLLCWSVIAVGLAIGWLGRQIVRARSDVTCVHPDHPGYGRGE